MPVVVASTTPEASYSWNFLPPRTREENNCFLDCILFLKNKLGQALSRLIDGNFLGLHDILW